MVPRLNPAQHRLFARHIERAVETLRAGDRLLRGALTDVVDRCEKALRAELAAVEAGHSTAVTFPIQDVPMRILPYVEDPFVQALVFNLHCMRTQASHTQASKDWKGGPQAVAARNLVFLPPIYHQLWSDGVLDKTRLINIANRNLTHKAYLEVADLVRSRRKEDVDERLLRLPPGSVQLGRRGPEQAMEAAKTNGWLDRLKTVEVPGELVMEAGLEEPAEADVATDGASPDAAPGSPATAAGAGAPSAAPASRTGPGTASAAGAAASQATTPPRTAGRETPADIAAKALRAGLSGARIAPEVQEALTLSPDPQVLVERYLAAHRKTGDPDPETVTKTLFFAHAGPMQKLVADDKLLLRHFRPVKTQKRGQLFYRLLEVIEEAMLERNHDPRLDARGLSEQEAMVAVRKVIVDLNRDPNRFLQVPDDWLGEVTRRHLYFGSRTRKEGAAYKWFRRIGTRFFLGAHKTEEEIQERNARRAAKAAGSAGDVADDEAADAEDADANETA